IEQVERPPVARGRQVTDDGAGDAAGRARHEINTVRAERQTRLSIGRRLLDKRHGVSVILIVADFDDTGVRQCLGQQRIRQRRRFSAWLEVDYLNQGIASLALVGLRETADRAAQWGCGPVRSVAVKATQPRGRYEEGP